MHIKKGFKSNFFIKYQIFINSYFLHRGYNFKDCFELLMNYFKLNKDFKYDYFQNSYFFKLFVN